MRALPSDAIRDPATSPSAGTPKAPMAASSSVGAGSLNVTGPGSKDARIAPPLRLAYPANVRPPARNLNSCLPAPRCCARKAKAATVPCPQPGSSPAEVKNRSST